MYTLLMSFDIVKMTSVVKYDINICLSNAFYFEVTFDYRLSNGNRLALNGLSKHLKC